jgi:hypothetical protein
VIWYKGFLYQAESWKTARRVVAKVEFHFGELFPRVGFIVTNLETDSRAVVRFYNKRGTAEQWIKEGKQAVKMTRLSCHRFRSNEVRLWLSVIAYNLGNLWRRLVLPNHLEFAGWDPPCPSRNLSPPSTESDDSRGEDRVRSSVRKNFKRIPSFRRTESLYRLCFTEYDATAAAGPIGQNYVGPEAGGREFVDQNCRGTRAKRDWFRELRFFWCKRVHVSN